MKLAVPSCSSPRFLAVLVRLCVAGVFVAPGTARAQEASVLPPGYGTHLFRLILHDCGLTPLSRLNDLNEDAENKILVVLGETEVLDHVPGGLESFVARGGALLLATDRTAREKSLMPFGLFVSGSRPVSTRTSTSYRSSAECIRVTSESKTKVARALFTRRDEEGRVVDIEVVTNRAGYLVRRSNQLPTLANFPSGTVVRDRSFGPGPWPFAAGGLFGKGRILILADHSVFINALLWQGDTGNRDFAYNCVHWLADGRPKQVLFVEEGDIQDAFGVPLAEPPPPPFPPVDRVVRTVDQAIQGMEEEDRFNPMLTDLVERIGKERLARTLLLVLAGVVALYGLSRLSQARQRFEPGLIPPDSYPDRQTRSAPLLERRKDALAENRNYWEPARQLAQRFFESVLGTSLVASDVRAGAVPKPPPVSVRGSWLERWQLRRRWHQLWRLAYDPRPTCVSPRRFKSLSTEIDWMRAALARRAIDTASGAGHLHSARP
jgi:hypothetical protein